MRNKIISLAAIATILFFGACSNQDEVLTDIDNAPVRTLSLTASMPDAEPQTRVDLTRNGKNIELKWVVNDVIELVFVHDVGGTETKTKATTSVSSVSANGKVATFTINLPTAVTAATFNLYGGNGGNGLADASINSAFARLPGSPSTNTSLNDAGDDSVQKRKDVMLYFSSVGIAQADLQATVTFKHLGSLIGLTLNDVNTAAIALIDTKKVAEVRLVGVNSLNVNWAYNSISCGQYFDLVNEQFIALNTGSDYISFKLNSLTVNPVNDIITLWGWYPMTGVAWPELQLQILDSAGTVLLTSSNTKAAKATAPVAGKTYHFYGTRVGADLFFANEQFVVPTP